MPHKTRAGGRNLKTNKRPVGLIAPPYILGFLAAENLPKVSSNIAQNHSSGLLEVTSGHYLPNSHENLPKSKLGQVGVGSNIAQNHSSSL